MGAVRPGMCLFPSALMTLATMTSLAFAGTPGVVPASPKDQVVIDANGDGRGDTPGSLQVVEGRVGENEVDADEVRYCVPFVLNDDEAARIAASGDPVTLHVYLVSKMNTTGGSVAVFGLTNHVGEGVTIDDFQAAAVVVKALAVTDTSPGGGFIAVDATTFVKGEVGKGARVIAFRFEFRPRPSPMDGKINRFVFRTADSVNPPFLRYE